MNLAMSPEMIALLSTFIGAGGLKLIEKWFNRHKFTVDEKRDYRTEIKELRERLDAVEEEVNEWRDRYYRNEEEINRLRTFIIGFGEEPPERNRRPPRP